MEPSPLEITLKFCLASKRVGYQQIQDQPLLFLQYHLNNLNAKAKFKCLFLSLI